MALEDIFKALEEQGDRDIAESLAAAHAQADAITAEATDQAEDIRRQRVEVAERAARVASAQRLNAARLDARKRLAAIKERALQLAFEDARAGFADARSSADYPKLFRALAEEALQGVGGDASVRVDPADEALARETLAALGSTARVTADLSTTGGIVVETDGGRIIRDNTLEARLDKLRGIAQAEVAEILFS